MNPPALVYCHCQYAKVLPDAVKNAVLRKLCDSAQPFEAVADLCELSARKDPMLARLAATGPVKLAACFPRAVKWLFASGGAPLDHQQVEVINLRTLTAEQACAALFEQPLSPNLPAGKETRPAVEPEPVAP